MIVKICGITSVEDALLALELEANALGFNFWPSSPRYVSPESAQRIISEVQKHFDPSSFLTVGILVGTQGWEQAPTEVLQFHGVRDAAGLPETGRRTWVAVTPQLADRFPSSEILIDSSWGQGKVADWEEVARVNRPFILSGGLGPENVYASIEHLRPVGVDVCSGVEKSPGRKDPEKLKRFLGEVKRAIHGTTRISRQ
ncbi:MAG TPA: phosphoribosylanthranilate isomerase [Acidobacteriota bacterium]|nr:phosphoribosylanthranilate isomerase [Acidobacteriota bacterium]